MTTRVLVWSGYASWAYHTAVEAFLVHGLRRRGAEVTVVACDGCFTECDAVRWRADGLSARPTDACAGCQGRARDALAAQQLDAAWLSRWVPDGARARASAWAETLRADQLLDAMWSQQPVGLWAQSSALFHFRACRFDASDPAMVAIVRAQVADTAVAWEAMSRLFDDVRPDVLLTLNGRFFSHRVAVALARQRGVRLVTHECGYAPHSVALLADQMVHELPVMRRVWADRADTPLPEDAAHQVWAGLQGRRFGGGVRGARFSPPPGEADQLRGRLGLDDRPVVACFSSSDDEFAAFPERMAGAFPDSLTWLPETVRLARTRPDLQWVLRLHPNLLRHGGSQQAMDAALRLQPDLPANCRLVLPGDDVSSYTLADLCAATVVYNSTLGLEQACLGRPVVAVAQGWFGHTGFVRRVDDRDDYLPAVLDAVATRPHLSVARKAWRFWHGLWAETALPTTPWLLLDADGTGHAADPRDPALDKVRVLRRMLDLVERGAPLSPPPEPGARAGHSALEDHLLLDRMPHLDADPEAEVSPLRAASLAARAASTPMGRAQGWLAVAAAHPDAAEPRRELGRALLDAGRPGPAVDPLKLAVTRTPSDAEAWALLVRATRAAQGGPSADRLADVARRRGLSHPDLSPGGP